MNATSKASLPTTGGRTFPTASGKSLAVSVDILHIPSLVAEDKHDLVGYEAIRSAGEVDATWTSAVVYVDDDGGNTLDVIGTRTLPAVFDKLLDGQFRTTPLNREFAALSASMGVLTCIRQSARHERLELCRARAAKLLTELELGEELERVKREEDGAFKRYKKFFDNL